MWTADDIARSIRRYLSLALPDPWTLRVERREVRDEERPVAVVEVGGLAPLRAREAITQGEVESAAPVTVTAYPPLPAEEEGVDPLRQARLEAHAIASGLGRWLTWGMTVTTKDEDGKTIHWASPFRIPLYDYAGVPLTGDERKGPEDPHDVMWVPRESIGIEPIADNEDLRRWSVACDFRVSIESPGRERNPDEGFMAEGIEGTFTPP